MARPTKYDTHVKPYFDKIKAWAERGATQKEIAKALNIAESTFQDYLNKYPELSELLKSKDMKPLIDDLENALRSLAQPGDIILTVGAGDVYRIGERLVEEEK